MPIEKSMAQRARDLAYQLTAWPSETGTKDEAAFSQRLAGLIREIPYFRAHPDHLVTVESHGEPMTENVIALVRGEGSACLVLAGHFDTVSIANYGHLAPLARDPEGLTEALVDALSSAERSASEDRALNDLFTGDFIPGRGLLDMKSGVAAGLAALEAFAALEERQGSLMLIVTPDEENRSRGMRSARNALPGLAARWGVEVVGGINLDATSDMGDGADGRSIYRGTVGKLLPFAYVIGRPTHAAYPFDGVSSHLIGAEILRAIEANPALCDEAFGEKAAPPVCLEATDFRPAYDVTTPDRFWLAFNWLTQISSPQDVLGLFEDIVSDAMQRAMADQNVRAQRHFGGGSEGPSMPPAPVLTFAELKERAFARGGADAKTRHAALLEKLKHEENPLLVSRTITAQLVAEARLEGPAAVVGLGSLHYPHTQVDDTDLAQARFIGAIERVGAAVARRRRTSVRSRPYFPGISDMSFLGQRAAAEQADFVAANTPSPEFIDRAAADALAFPVVNIGPWGREYHQRLERVHAPYAFEVLPQLLYEIALDVLGGAMPAAADGSPPR